MSPKTNTQLSAFLTNISSDASARKSFLKDPLKTISTFLQLPQIDSGMDNDLTNSIVLSALRSPEAISAIKKINAKRDAMKIDDMQTKQETAKVLLDAAPDDLKIRLIALWGGENPSLPGFNPQAGMANIIVHVDVVVVMTKAAVMHEDIVFSGSISPRQSELQKIANSLAQGQ